MDHDRQLATKTIYPIGDEAQNANRRQIVLLHGFTQNSNVMAPFGRLLANLTQRAVDVVDLPGHGGSADVNLNLSQTAALLAKTFARSIWVGYSLGGRILYHLAEIDPTKIDAMVLIGSNPGLADPEARLARLRADRETADRLAKIASRGEFMRFLTEWLAGPVFGGIDPALANLAARLDNEPRALSKSLVGNSLGTQTDMTMHLANLDSPPLYLFGSRDAKFRAIATEMKAALGAHIEIAEIQGAGHYVLGEAPYRCASETASFLARHQIE